MTPRRILGMILLTIGIAVGGTGAAFILADISNIYTSASDGTLGVETDEDELRDGMRRNALIVAGGLPFVVLGTGLLLAERVRRRHARVRAETAPASTGPGPMA